ncbi:alpha/beta hydrolase [Kordiimonas gwangyangensis]|uniref:alpha/beta hydrolase n=1 Tax=Kordiimonas gwangyangensis TaxID=288022 RepID=UPI00047299C3|nr:alpha/beta hydrolase [Kordiimonas gwangyangensis]
MASMKATEMEAASGAAMPGPAFMAYAKQHRRDVPEDAVFGQFEADDGESIRYARFPASKVIEPKGTIIFMPGRTEFIEKFLEDVHLFNQMGFACAAMDLRGQGMSFRPHPNRNKHFVKTFDTHISDVRAFFDKKLINKMPKPFILMGHSAGSHVILRFLHDHPDYVEAAITVAPMVKIYTKPLPAFFVNGLPAVMRALGQGAAYIPGHTASRRAAGAGARN